MPGYVNYHYNSKTGNKPGHTKLAFSKYAILAIQNLIALNALLFIHKIKTFPSLIPLSVRLTISEDSPTTESTYESCEDWLKKYNNHIYNKSVFFKGPMLAATSIINEVFSPESFVTLKAYKENLKKTIRLIQEDGDAVEWQNENFVLYNLDGLRRSELQRERVNYTTFFE